MYVFLKQNIFFTKLYITLHSIWKNYCLNASIIFIDTELNFTLKITMDDINLQHVSVKLYKIYNWYLVYLYSPINLDRLIGVKLLSVPGSMYCIHKLQT